MSYLRSADSGLDKYVVLKSDEWARGEGKPLDPDTFFVIRNHDVFGAAALYGYAHLVQTSIETARMRPGQFTDEEIARLGALADTLASLADTWLKSHMAKKVPD